jgi:mRNA deadenylase 3'-5' endonuclease subunit Ccr4
MDVDILPASEREKHKDYYVYNWVDYFKYNKRPDIINEQLKRFRIAVMAFQDIDWKVAEKIDKDLTSHLTV